MAMIVISNMPTLMMNESRYLAVVTTLGEGEIFGQPYKINALVS